MKLYVGNLSPQVDDKRLKGLFAGYSPVSATVITEHVSGTSRGYGSVEIENLTLAQRAIREMHTRSVDGRKMVVREARKEYRPQVHPHDQQSNREGKLSEPLASGPGPYRFIKRKAGNGDKGKEKPVALHDRLLPERYDIAFEISWRTETPTAANPCTDTEVAECCPQKHDSSKKEYAGFNKRWLMIDNRLAISPFTVKSAIANGFAAVMGGCYRVVSRMVPHSHLEEGHYPYSGKYKRYRVSMNNKSLPGILVQPDLKIHPVDEYFYDEQNLPTGLAALKRGDVCIATWHHVEKDRKLTILSLRPDDGRSLSDGEVRVTYYGPYEFGMNLSLQAGELGKRHHHRFYARKNGPPVEGVLPELHFAPEDDLKAKVYMGCFKRQDEKIDRRSGLEGKAWLDEMTALPQESWVYYTGFKNVDGQFKVTGIGRNFLFKTLFLHEDTVPADSKLCRDMELLCPRCAMFGMTDVSGLKNREAVGLAGRFKASTLVSDRRVVGQPVLDAGFRAPYCQERKLNNRKTYELKHHEHGEKPISVKLSGTGDLELRQMLLPILGEPKPNKRDVNGYYDQVTGEMKGTKTFIHSTLGMSGLQKWLKEEVNTKTAIHNGKKLLPYAHPMRSYAQVCPEGVEFKGTVGAENCSPDEIAALLMLLEYKIAGHGFKIGLGKSYGLGSVTSSIGKIWVRRTMDHEDHADHYQWKKVQVGGDIKETLTRLKSEIDGLGAALETHRKVGHLLNSWDKRSSKQPVFPPPGPGYWSEYHWPVDGN